MTLAQKTAFIQETLEKLYPDPSVPLNHTDPYSLLIAVLLSAQCTDERVNRVTPALFARAQGPMAMAAMQIAEIEAIIRPCGLSANKSKAIHRLSEILVQQYDGKVPDDMEALESLPGVGHKTASVVMIQAFGRHFPSTRISIGLRQGGGCQMGHPWSEPRPTSSLCFPSPVGPNCICKSFTSVGNIARREAMISVCVPSAARLGNPWCSEKK